MDSLKLSICKMGDFWSHFSVRRPRWGDEKTDQICSASQASAQEIDGGTTHSFESSWRTECIRCLLKFLASFDLFNNAPDRHAMFLRRRLFILVVAAATYFECVSACVTASSSSLSLRFSPCTGRPGVIYKNFLSETLDLRSAGPVF